MKNIKNILIGVLIALIVLGGIFGGKKIRKFTEEITTLKAEKTALNGQIAERDAQIKALEAQNVTKDKKIDSCMVAFKQKEKIITGLSEDLAEALSKLNGITSDSSYQFLQRIAYNFPGDLKYPFNELQVKGIHADYLKARSADQIIPVYKDQIRNCLTQFALRDSAVNNLNKVVALQKQNLADCGKINQDNDRIIRDVEKQRNKERHRKNFWRFTTSLATGGIIALALVL